MRGHSDKIKRALSALDATVTAQLAAEGWQRRTLDQDDIAILTRTAPSGVMAVVHILRRGWRWPDDWPIEVSVCLGANYEPALNLMPLVTLPALAILIDDPEYGRGDGFAVSIESEGAVGVAASEIVRFVGQHGTRAADGFADGSAIDAELQRLTSERSAEEDETANLIPARATTQLGCAW